MKKISSIAVVMLVVAIFASGCKKNTEDANVVDNTNLVTQAPTSEGSKESKEESEKDAVLENENENASIDTVQSSAYTYVDVTGRSIALEEQPVKIAVDYLPLWETLLMLDVTPYAATGVENYRETWDAFEGVEMGEIIELGTTEVNLELLTDLEPDLVLSQVYDLSKVDVTNLEQIAPVAVFGPETKMDWRLSLREVAKAIGKTEKAEEVITEVDALLADARSKLQDVYNEQTVMQISMMGEDRYYITYRPDLYDKETGLGLQLPEGYTTNENYEQITMEAIVEMNPDHIFINVFDSDDATFEELNNNSVWQSLKAVKEGHVYRLDGSGHACSALSTLYTVNFMIDTLLNNQ